MKEKTQKQQHQVVQDNRSTYRIFIRYSNLVFFLTFSLLLIVASVLLLNMINGSGGAVDSSLQLVNGTFDSETIKKVEELTKKQTTSPQLPSGRINPFVE